MSKSSSSGLSNIQTSVVKNQVKHQLQQLDEEILKRPIDSWDQVLNPYKDDLDLPVSIQKKVAKYARQYGAYLKKKEHLTSLWQFDSQVFASTDHMLLVGVDEAGRGPLAGPVVAAACSIDFDLSLLILDDSKKLSADQREALFELIIDKANAYGIGIVDNERIDEINILNATKEAMAMALINLECMAIDRNKDLGFIITDHVAIAYKEVPVLPVVKGDQKSYGVAAASILAKVTRDRMMLNWAIDYPQYKFEQHKGYGTAAHYEAIAQFGTTPLHRASFLKNLR